jgi:hypothetical protein
MRVIAKYLNSSKKADYLYDLTHHNNSLQRFNIVVGQATSLHTYDRYPDMQSLQNQQRRNISRKW